MKTFFVIFLLGVMYGLTAEGATAQKPTCEGNSYSSEVVNRKIISETCVEYEIKVSYDGKRTFGLSHFSIAIPCGEVKNISNSGNWKQAFGKDPTTGVYGLKVDNINGFGEHGASSFTVKFTWCSNDSCEKKLGIVAYKAGQCIDFQTLNDISCTNKEHSVNHNHSDGKCNSGGGSGSDKDNKGNQCTNKDHSTTHNQSDGKCNSGGGSGSEKDNKGDQCTNKDHNSTHDHSDGKCNSNSGGGSGSEKDNNGNQCTNKNHSSTHDHSDGKCNSGGGSDTTNGGAGGSGTTGSGSGGSGSSGDNGGDGSSGDGGGSNGSGDGSGTPTDSTKTTCSTLMAKLQKTNISCSGASNGQLQVLIQDGLAPFTYAWSTGETTASIQNLSAGSYVVTITDANKNVMTLTETLSTPQSINIAETIINPSCNGFTNGAISLAVTGGSGAYTYAWNIGSTQQNIGSLGSGSFTVIVTDAVGCTAQKSFTLTNTNVISAGVSFAHPSCSQSNGTIDITPTGGVAPYTYLWSTGATTQDLQNGTPGTYSVKITDTNGCSVDMVYALRINNTMVLKYAVTPTNCVDDSSGAINLTVTGGVAPYTYLWQDGITTEDRSGLKTGLYKVTVTDAGGCSSSINISVFKKTFTVNSVVTQPRCAGDLGAVTVIPVDGISPYTYSWSNGDKANSISGVTGGNYSVTITDASGCSLNMVFTISAPLSISATSVISNSQCGSEGSFAIDLSVSGGISPYTYAWSNGATMEDPSGLNSGNYSVKITDSNGCSVTQSIVVSPMSVSWTCLINQPVSEVVCQSAGNSLTTSMMDASTYQWTVTSSDNSWVITAGSSSTAIVYTAGKAGISATFTLTVTKDGCTKSCVYTASTSGCVQKDNTGGGDPLHGDPCSMDSTTITTDTPQVPVAVADVPLEQSSVEAEEQVADEEAVLPIELEVSAYPNPFTDRICFEWTAPADDHVQVEIMDLLGRRASLVFSSNVKKGQSYKCDWTPSGADRIYVYRFNSSKHTCQGKLFAK